MASNLKHWRYIIKNKEGWAIVQMSSDGFFSVVSDYGNYAYLWSDIGPYDFREFIVECDEHYIGKKLAMEWPSEFMAYETAKSIKNQICELRRNGSLECQTAREIYDSINFSDEYEFWQWHQDSVFAGVYELELVYEKCPMAFQFTKKMLPVLKEAIIKDLEREKLDSNV